MGGPPGEIREQCPVPSNDQVRHVGDEQAAVRDAVSRRIEDRFDDRRVGCDVEEAPDCPRRAGPSGTRRSARKGVAALRRIEDQVLADVRLKKFALERELRLQAAGSAPEKATRRWVAEYPIVRHSQITRLDRDEWRADPLADVARVDGTHPVAGARRELEVVEGPGDERPARHDRAISGGGSHERLDVRPVLQLAQAGEVYLSGCHGHRWRVDTLNRTVVEDVEKEHVGSHPAAYGEPRQQMHVSVDVDANIGQRGRIVCLDGIWVVGARRDAVLGGRRLIDAREVAPLEFLPHAERVPVPARETASAQRHFVEVKID